MGERKSRRTDEKVDPIILKKRLTIEYEILYNKEDFDPSGEIQLCFYIPFVANERLIGDTLYYNEEYQYIDHNIGKYKEDYAATVSSDPGDDFKNNDIGNTSKYSCHENRTSIWDVEYDSELDPIEKKAKLFQFDLNTTDVKGWLDDYDKNKIGKLEIINVIVALTPQELEKVERYEKLLDFDAAAEIYNKHGMDDEVIRVRRLKAKQGSVKVDQTIIHGDYVDDRDTTYVDDRDTIIKDSVVSKSNIGAGGNDKFSKLKELKEMFDSGFISKEEMEEMKKEILRK